MEEINESELKLDPMFLVKVLVRFIKRDISERYKQTGEITDEDWEFCEKIDWHPVDELPPKSEHVEKMKKVLKEGKFIKFNSVSEIFDEK